MCNICQAFADMSTQSILDHNTGCKAKCDKECLECEGPMKAPKKKKSLGQKETLQSHSSDVANQS